MMDDLTDFQRRAIADVIDAFEAAGRAPESQETLGNRERYLVVSFSGYRVLLYLDGAEILGNGIDLRFEKDDFENLDRLRERLLDELRPLLA